MLRKPQSYYRDIIWNGGDRVYATVRLPEPEGQKVVALGWATYPTLPSWTWPGQESKNLQVNVYSGAERVRLYLNGKLLGEKPSGRDQAYEATFSVPYAPGTLKAVGVRGGEPIAESIVTTSGKAVTLRLRPDRRRLRADGQDLAFILVEAVDDQDRLVQSAAQEVTFSLAGPGQIAAVGNGDGQDPASYQGTTRKLFRGRAEMILRLGKQSGELVVTASAPGLKPSTTKVEAVSSAPVAELE